MSVHFAAASPYPRTFETNADCIARGAALFNTMLEFVDACLVLPGTTRCDIESAGSHPRPPASRPGRSAEWQQPEVTHR